ncbi:MAG: Mpo1-like protein [Lysobacteraceae bacterium]
MNTNADIETRLDRPIDRWFANYSGDHQNATNQKIHVIAVPTILWTVTALLWCIPVPGTWFSAGFWAAIAAFFAWMFYYRASRPLGFGMLAVLIALLWFNRWLYATLGGAQMLRVAIAVFVLAWIAQFIGHKIEGKKPSFFTDLVYLLIGPAWVLGKLYRKLGWKF